MVKIRDWVVGFEEPLATATQANNARQRSDHATPHRPLCTSPYQVDPETGAATLLYGPPNDPPLEGPDGMSRAGHILYVVENMASRIAVIEIDPATGLGTLVKTLAVEGAQTPTTSAVFGRAIYTVDARLGTPFVGPYKIFRISR